MKLKNKISRCFLLILFLIINYKTKAAETIYLYKGNFNRKILVEELSNYEKTKIPSARLKKLLTVARGTAGFKRNIIFKKVPRILKEPDTFRMGINVIKKTSEKGLVRLVKVAAGVKQ